MNVAVCSPSKSEESNCEDEDSWESGTQSPFLSLKTISQDIWNQNPAKIEKVYAEADKASKNNTDEDNTGFT